METKKEKLGKVSITVEESYWDINKVYKKLTIVERQSTGTTYLSRKLVPARTSISNRKYWIKFSKWSDIPYEITQEFGDSTELVISQKVVTLKINELQNLINNINEIVGEGGSIDERFNNINNALNDRYTKEETYSKEQVNNLITTPNQQFVTVEATSQTTDVTDILPDTGSANTIYRVGNWNGTQYDPTVYSEYSWDGTNYIFLSKKEDYGDGVFDVSVKYPTSGVDGGNTYTLDGALNVLNNNLPAGKKKGGMSIKFVQSSDNKYVQARCMAQNFTTDVTQWQGVDDEPTAESKNLVDSGGVNSRILNLFFLGTTYKSWYYNNIKGVAIAGHKYALNLSDVDWNTVQSGDVFQVLCKKNNENVKVLGLAANDMPFNSSYTFTIPDDIDDTTLYIRAIGNSGVKVYFNITDITFSIPIIESVANETTARENADTTLSGRINDLNDKAEEIDSLNQSIYGRVVENVGYIDSDLKWNTTQSTSRHCVLAVAPGDSLKFAKGANNGSFAFLKDYHSSGVIDTTVANVSTVDGEFKRIQTESVEAVVPSDAKYVVVNLYTSNNVAPSSIKINGFEYNVSFSKQVDASLSALNTNLANEVTARENLQTDISSRYTPKYVDLSSSFVRGFYNTNNGNNNFTITDNSDWECAEIAAVAGELFNIKVQDGINSRPYNIITSDGYIFSRIPSGAGLKEYTFEMPIDGKILINNKKSNTNRYIHKLTLQEDVIKKSVHSDFVWGRIDAADVDSICDLTNIITSITQDGHYYLHTIIECSHNDLFEITINDRRTAPSYCFLDENNKVLTKSYYVGQSESIYRNKIIIAPEDAAKLLINVVVSANPFGLYKVEDSSVLDTVYDTLGEYYAIHGKTEPGDFIKVRSLTDVSATWWIHPRADIYGNGNIQLTAFGIVDYYGNVGVAVKDDHTGIFNVKLLKHTQNHGDDHNSSAVKFYDNKLYVGHASGHSYSENMYFYIFADPTDLLSYERYMIPTEENDNTTYCNMFHYDGYWYMFYRGSDAGWSCIKTADFTEYTIYKSGGGAYHNFQEIKGRDDIIRVTIVQNGAITPNKICSCILDLSTMDIYDYDDTLLGTFDDLGTLYSNLQETELESLIVTNNDFPYLRLYDVAYTEKENVRFIFGRSQGLATNENGSYYYYDNGVSIELGKMGNPFHSSSLYYPGGAISLYNDKEVIFVSKDHKALIQGCISGTSLTDKKLITDSPQEIIRPTFVHGAYCRYFYFDGKYIGTTAGNFTDHELTLREKNDIRIELVN